jgi:hypothetical protein
MAETKAERSLGELFAELSSETATLLRKEFELAQVEVGQKLSRAGRHAALIGTGGVIAHAGALAFVAALVMLLVVAGLPPWAAALIVAVVLVVVGALLVRSGLAAMRAEDMTPRETIDTLKEGAAWAKQQTR